MLKQKPHFNLSRFIELLSWAAFIEIYVELFGVTVNGESSVILEVANLKKVVSETNENLSPKNKQAF